MLLTSKKECTTWHDRVEKVVFWELFQKLKFDQNSLGFSDINPPYPDQKTKPSVN